MSSRFINVFVTDRSRPDEVSTHLKGGGTQTRLEALEDIQRTGRGYMRSDIVTVNVVSGEKHLQFHAAPTWDGEPRGEAMEWLTPEELEEARRINRAIVTTAMLHKPFEYLLGTRRAWDFYESPGGKLHKIVPDYRRGEFLSATTVCGTTFYPGDEDGWEKVQTDVGYSDGIVTRCMRCYPGDGGSMRCYPPAHIVEAKRAAIAG